MRAYNNLSVLAQEQDRLDELLRAVEDGIALARRRGDRSWEWILSSTMVEYQSMTGAWDDALATAAEMPYGSPFVRLLVLSGGVHHARSRRAGRARRGACGLRRHRGPENSPDLQARGFALLARASLHRAEGTLTEARADAQAAYPLLAAHAQQYSAEAGAELCEASFRLGELEPVEQLLGEWAAFTPARRPLSLQGQEARIRGRLAGLEGDTELVERQYMLAVRAFREVGYVFWLAVSLLEHGEWLAGAARADEARPMLDEATALFEQMKARPWLDVSSEHALSTPSRSELGDLPVGRRVRPLDSGLMSLSLADSVIRVPHSRIRELAEMAMAMPDVLRLYFGESDQPTPDFIKQAAVQALEDGYTFYSENAGLPSLRGAIAGQYSRLHGIELDSHERGHRHGIRRPGAPPGDPLRPRRRG